MDRRDAPLKRVPPVRTAGPDGSRQARPEAIPVRASRCPRCWVRWRFSCSAAPPPATYRWTSGSRWPRRSAGRRSSRSAAPATSSKKVRRTPSGRTCGGVVGRPVASAEGFDRYTPAMESYGGVWSPERLDRYLRHPMVEIEGNDDGLSGCRCRGGPGADLIAWLEAGPRRLPRPEAGARSGGAGG